MSQPSATGYRYNPRQLASALLWGDRGANPLTNAAYIQRFQRDLFWRYAAVTLALDMAMDSGDFYIQSAYSSLAWGLALPAQIGLTFAVIAVLSSVYISATWLVLARYFGGWPRALREELAMAGVSLESLAFCVARSLFLADLAVACVRYPLAIALGTPEGSALLAEFAGYVDAPPDELAAALLARAWYIAMWFPLVIVGDWLLAWLMIAAGGFPAYVLRAVGWVLRYSIPLYFAPWILSAILWGLFRFASIPLILFIVWPLLWWRTRRFLEIMLERLRVCEASSAEE